MGMKHMCHALLVFCACNHRVHFSYDLSAGKEKKNKCMSVSRLSHRNHQTDCAQKQAEVCFQARARLSIPTSASCTSGLMNILMCCKCPAAKGLFLTHTPSCYIEPVTNDYDAYYRILLTALPVLRRSNSHARNILTKSPRCSDFKKKKGP